MTNLERDQEFSAERLKASDFIRLAVRIDDSEEIMPVFVSPSHEDGLSQFVNAEVTRIEKLVETPEFTKDESLRLNVLSGDLVAVVHLKTDEGSVASYEISPFEDRKQLEWFQFLDEYPELAVLCETNKTKYDIVRDFFSLRYNHATQHKGGEEISYHDLLSDFNTKLDEKINNDLITDEEVDDLANYLSIISERFSVI